MIDEPDGVVHEVEQLLQRGGQAASELARNRMLKRAQELREAARESEQRTREAHARFETERQVARAQLAAFDREHWWEHATARDIVDTWHTAQQWREHDPQADRTAIHMRAEMIDRLGFDPATVADAPCSEPDSTHTGQRRSALTPEEGCSSETEPVLPRLTGERGRELRAMLLELRETRRINAAAQQRPVADAIRNGGPRRSPRAPRSRRPVLGAERERAR